MPRPDDVMQALFGVWCVECGRELLPEEPIGQRVMRAGGDGILPIGSLIVSPLCVECAAVPA